MTNVSKSFTWTLTSRFSSAVPFGSHDDGRMLRRFGGLGFGKPKRIIAQHEWRRTTVDDVFFLCTWNFSARKVTTFHDQTTLGIKRMSQIFASFSMHFSAIHASLLLLDVDEHNKALEA